MDAPFRCPHCNALVVDRRSSSCTTCRQALPAEWIMTPDQIAKSAALDKQSRAQHAESMETLAPLKYHNPDAPVFVQILTTNVDSP